MSQGDEFKFQGGAAANTEREQGNECGKNCDHAHDGMAVARKSLAFLNFLSFEQPQQFALPELNDLKLFSTCALAYKAGAAAVRAARGSFDGVRNAMGVCK